MNTKFHKFSFKKIDKLRDNEIEDIIYLVKNENPKAIIASFSKKNIKLYLQNILHTKNLIIFVLKRKNKIIAYSLIAKKPKFLTSTFKKMKFKILFDLIINFQFHKIITIVISYLNFDILFLSREKKKLINSNYNLNLLAVNKKYQSKGIGSYFLKRIFRLIKNSKFITVESIDERAYKFYEKKHNFIFLGEKFRFRKNLRVLYKKLT